MRWRLNRGEFLAGQTLPDAVDFELWLLGELTRLRALWERGLSELAARSIALGRYESAIQWAQQLVQSNPLLEEAHADLIRLYAQTGQRQAALQQYERCSDLLRQELAVEPMPELQALYARVAAGESGAPSPSTLVATEDLRQPADFVGRDAELAQLHQAWQAARRGQGTVVLLEAEAGGGKTRLAHEFSRSLSEAVFLAGQCYESTRALPYRPWIDILEARLAGLDDATLTKLPALWLEQLMRLLPALAHRLGRDLPTAPPTAGGELERLFTAVTEFLFRLPDTPPLLIFVDNLQWADEASLQLFHFVARRVPRAGRWFSETRGALLMGAFRSEELYDVPALQALVSDLQRDPLLHLRLEPLALESIIILTAQLWPKLPAGYRPQVCAMLGEATGGNPLFVTEVLRELAHTTAPPPTLPVPPSVRDLVHHRLRQLPESARQVTEAIAVLGSPVTLAQARQTSARSDEETVTAIDLGLRWRLLQPAVESHTVHYDFSHDLVREAVVSQLSDVRRRLLHRRAATTLEQAGGQAATLAYHWGMAGDVMKEAHYAALAGEQAAACYANDEAVRYLERALLLITEPERRMEVMRKLGDVWELVGRWAEAEIVFRKALELAESVGDSQTQAQHQVVLGKLMRQQGSYTEALMWLERARAVYETLGDQQGLSEAVGGMGAVYWCQLDYPRALACFEQKLHIAKEVGDRQGASQAVGSMGVVYTELGDYSLALACYGQDLQIATELGDRLRIGKVVGNMGTVYLEQGDYRRGLACYEQQLQIAVESGDRFMTCVSVGNMVPVYAVQGDYSTADRLSRQAIVLGRALNIPLYLCEYLLNKADLYVRQRRYDAGQHLNHEALSVATQIERKDIQFLAEVLSVRLRARLHQIDMPAAIGKLEALLDEWPEDSQQAAVQYEIWRLDPTQATCRQNAADLYRDLYARTPNIKYRQRYTELTRDALPDPTPLPGLPEIVTQNPVDRDALLAQVDQMITELEG